ncbi:MAG: lysophospholipid acyltransferase family protein [Bacteroidales bacterium]|nr:lysophospholipid acyltransferase family protein [Bacteroidales bacterium]MCF8403944.1 lysophospholipid acyltransferase family protein [Bacteroidales bacterium]
MKYIAKIILRLFGWRVTVGMPADVPKCVVVVAPHTSMWDFVIGRLCYFELGLKVKFLIKKEMFFFPLGPIVKWLGGIPVDRSKSGNLVDIVAGYFSQYDSLYITITPEGTRKKVENWKKGFYYIALKAKVPIALGILDYKEKIGGVGKVFTPSGNYEEDFKIVKEFYKGKGARHPEKFNLS